MLIVPHCHSLYSFDCKTKISDIIEACKKTGIGCIAITDHDVFQLSKADRELFEKSKIILLNAIEFTTNEGAHIIGIHRNIKQFEKDRHYYKSSDLVKLLIDNHAWIIIPHPTHETGIISVQLDETDLYYCLKNAHFVEIASTKYGKFDCGDILNKYSNLTVIVSDDAHKPDEIGCMVNYVKKELSQADNYEHILRKLHNNNTLIYSRYLLLKKTYKYYMSKTRIYKWASANLTDKEKIIIKSVLGL